MNKTATYTVILMLLGIGQTSLFGQAVKETSATIALATGANPQGVIQGANAQGIIFSSVSGQPGKLVPYSSIRGEGLDKLVRIGARNEFLGNPRALFAAGKYSEAAVEFGKVSDAFAFLIELPKSFAVEARFFQIESLRRAQPAHSSRHDPPIRSVQGRSLWDQRSPLPACEGVVHFDRLAQGANRSVREGDGGRSSNCGHNHLVAA